MFSRYGISKKSISRRRSLRYSAYWRGLNLHKRRSIRWRSHGNRVQMFLYDHKYKRPENGKLVTSCDDCWYEGDCKAPLYLDDGVYLCMIDENTGEWLE